MERPENDYIKVEYNPETDEVLIYTNIKSYKDMFGLLEHAKMQMTCRYNEDYVAKTPDDDIFTE